MSARESSITVAVRVRPFTPSESAHLVKQRDDNIFLGDGALSFNENKENRYQTRRSGPQGLRKIVDVVDDRMLIFDPPDGNNPLVTLSKNAFPGGKRTSRFREHRFVFDKLFDTQAKQENVYYDTTRPLLDSVLDGFNATVFAYGATGCGKTHTISGTVEEPGIIFLTMKELFERIRELQDTKHIDVSLSYLEIYNETIRDLMEPNSGKVLTLREDASNRITVSNLSTHRPESVEDVMDMIIIGNKNRTCSPTAANATSSRSHAVLQINVNQKGRTADIRENHTFATLSIIDLAGSERAAATKNRGERLHEGANINKSLLALGNCINALCDSKRKHHVPYRDSKLTRLLKFSLGGNCKTVMIVCISPSSHHYDETLNTLKYADRAKEIKTKLIRNQHNLNRHVGSYLKMITEQKQEIEELRTREAAKLSEAIEGYKTKKERVSIGILEFIDNLKLSLNSKKFENLKLRKSLILCKRRLLIHQKVELKRYLKTFDHLIHQPEEFVHVSTALSDILKKLQVKIDELEILYNQETELDLVLSGSANSGIRRLTELEGWTDYDKILLESSLSLIRDSIEKTVLHNSFVAFDKLINSQDFNGNFRFTSASLLNIVSRLDFLKDNSDEVDSFRDEFQDIIEQFYNGFEDSLNDLINIDHKFEKFSSIMQYNITSDIHIPTSPIRKLAKGRASSPLKGSPRLSKPNLSYNSKVTKIGSPTQKETKSKKKVRWSVPERRREDSSDSNKSETTEEDDDEAEEEIDDSKAEEVLAKTEEEDNDGDVSMNDLMKTSALDIQGEVSKSSAVDESTIDQSLLEIEQALAAPKKRKSLTSKPLKPNLKKNINTSYTPNEFVLNEPIINNYNTRVTSEPIGLGAPIRITNMDSSLLDTTMNDN